MNLVIVESGAKAKTIQKYLGSDYLVTSCYGHIQKIDEKSDLTRSDGDNLPRPKWVFIDKKAKEFVTKSKKTIKTKKIGMVYAATDPDREGELIAFRLAELFEKTVPVKRMVFQEITKNAIQKALEKADRNGSIDSNMVNSALVRTYVDRLVGFGCSKYLQNALKKYKKRGLSMGRVQTPTLGFVLEREEKIKSHKPEKYYEFHIMAHGFTFKAIFKNPYKKNKHQTKDLEEVKGIQNLLKTQKTLVLKTVKTRDGKSNPPNPFSTDTFIQAAGNQGISPKAAMTGAQKLYQSGKITYMRTDSTRINPSFESLIAKEVEQKFGKNYLSNKTSKIKKKDKAKIQDAHEAIRTTTLQSSGVEQTSKRIYEIILKRTLASQMAASKNKTLTLVASLGDEVDFAAVQTYVTFAGYQKIYGKSEEKIPSFSKGENFEKLSMSEPYGLLAKETKPPARYKQYTLIQKMKDTGIGRPSTYVSTVEKLTQREYVKVVKGNIFPESIANPVMDVAAWWGNETLGHLFNPGFTQSFEDELDRIERGQSPAEPIWGAVRNYFQNRKNQMGNQISLLQAEFLKTKIFAYAVQDKKFWKKILSDSDKIVELKHGEKLNLKKHLKKLFECFEKKTGLTADLRVIPKKTATEIIEVALEDEGFSAWGSVQRTATKKQISFISSLQEKKDGADRLVPKNLKTLEIGKAAKLIKSLLALPDIPGKETKPTPRQINAIKKISQNFDVTAEEVVEKITKTKKGLDEISIEEASRILGILFKNVKKQKKDKGWRLDYGL